MEHTVVVRHHAEQHHLYRVLTGELRQGANEGVVADGVAKARVDQSAGAQGSDAAG